MLETELKCIISKEVFEKVRNTYTWDKVINQTNHYYRALTPILKQNGITFRVREIDNTFKLQIKKHKNADSPLQICEEFEKEIQNVPDFFDAKTVFELTGIENCEVFLLGSATTKRFSLMWDSITEICLDYTTYLDTDDYEIEIEYQGECPQELLEEMKNLGIEFKEKSKGKYSRFLNKFLEVTNK